MSSIFHCSRNNVLGIVNRYGMDNWRILIGLHAETEDILSSPKLTDRLQELPSLLFNG